MRLSAYLKEKNETASAFARRFKPPLSRATVSRLMSGERRPSHPLALAIEQATAGAVPADSWKWKNKRWRTASSP